MFGKHGIANGLDVRRVHPAQVHMAQNAVIMASYGDWQDGLVMQFIDQNPSGAQNSDPQGFRLP